MDSLHSVFDTHFHLPQISDIGIEFSDCYCLISHDAAICKVGKRGIGKLIFNEFLGHTSLTDSDDYTGLVQLLFGSNIRSADNTGKQK